MKCPRCGGFNFNVIWDATTRAPLFYVCALCHQRIMAQRAVAR